MCPAEFAYRFCVPQTSSHLMIGSLELRALTGVLPQGSALDF